MRSTRAAILAVAMNVMPVAPLDLFRYLNVPAIVLIMRNVRARVCSDARHRRARVTNRSRS